MPSIFEKRDAYKPFSHPWAFDAYLMSEQIHWLITQIPLGQDVTDWNTKLSPAEKNLLTQVFRFFTQADIDVASGYIDKYLPRVKPTEIRMMMLSFAAREAVHIHAYSTLIDQVGLPEVEYSAFMDYQSMRDKHEFMWNQQTLGDEMSDFARDMAVFSAFGEGLQLFSSFVILLNFTRFGKMINMGQAISWSIRDESLHVEGMLKVFHALLDEKPEVWTEPFKKTLYQTARDMVALEDRFIDLAFDFQRVSLSCGNGGIEGLTADEVKRYIRFIADRRLVQLGLKPNWGVAENPLPWVDVIVFGKEHTNFFENKASDYAKPNVSDWDDAFDDEPAIPFTPLYLIYSKPPGMCPSCDSAKALLASKHLPFDLQVFTTEAEITAFKSHGFKTFPQVWEQGENGQLNHIGGYEALVAHLEP